MGEALKSSLDLLVRSWNECHGAFYQVSGDDLDWNIRQQSLIHYTGDSVNGVPVLWGRASPQGINYGILPGGLWLSLHGKVPQGSEADFAREVERYARESGAKRIAIASDEFHFFPGIPVTEPTGEKLAAAFLKAGFSSADCADFVGDPKNAKTVAYVNEGVSAAKERGWTFLAVTPEEKNELHSFLKTEFSARWAREFIVWGERADTQRGFWHLLRDEKNKLIGFSRMAVRGRHKPLSAGWTPGAIRLPLTAGVPRLDTDSCLGPIGISKSERGRGSGKILLALTIHEISLQGGVRTCIDWTNAYNYYTPLGFEIARRFLSVWKEL